MPSDPTPPGKWFADDLRRVRESLGLSRDDLVAKLKIDPTILDAFEESGLVGHPRYNRVYLTVFVRGIGEALSLPTDAVSQALDQVYRGTYQGGIGVRFLGDPETAADAVDTAATADHAPASPVPGHPRKTEGSGVVVPAPNRIVVRRPVRWIAATLVLVAAVVAAVLFIPRLTGSAEPAAPAAQRVPDPAPEPEPTLAPRYVVGDTMRLYVVALDTLNPVRVKVDDRLRAPYWIEPGDSLAFDVRDRIVIERRADRMAISVGGRRIPLVDADSEGTVPLTRARVQEILDSLRTAS